MAYTKGGRTYQKAVGSRAEVKHRVAHHTAGGLKDSDLTHNSSGKIVSRKASALAKRVGLKRLAKAGYAPFKKGSSTVRRLRA